MAGSLRSKVLSRPNLIPSHVVRIRFLSLSSRDSFEESDDVEVVPTLWIVCQRLAFWDFFPAAYLCESVIAPFGEDLAT
jgi:hypothetical protein